VLGRGTSSGKKSNQQVFPLLIGPKRNIGRPQQPEFELCFERLADVIRIVECILLVISCRVNPVLSCVRFEFFMQGISFSAIHWKYRQHWPMPPFYFTFKSAWSTRGNTHGFIIHIEPGYSPGSLRFNLSVPFSLDPLSSVLSFSFL
jgi:hypothetical protein